MDEDHTLQEDEIIEGPESKKKVLRDRDFWLGFLGWFVINGGLYGIQLLLFILVDVDPAGTLSTIFGLGALVINVGALIFFAIKQRPRVVLGLLTPIFIGLILGICLGIFLVAVCFLPGGIFS